MLWKKKKMLLLTYADETGLEQHMLFNTKKKTDEIAATVYQYVAAAKRGA